MKVGFLIVVALFAGGAIAQTPPTGQKGPMQSKGAPGQVSDEKLKQLEAAYTSAKALIRSFRCRFAQAHAAFRDFLTDKDKARSWSSSIRQSYIVADPLQQTR